MGSTFTLRRVTLGLPWFCAMFIVALGLNCLVGVDKIGEVKSKPCDPGKDACRRIESKWTHVGSGFRPSITLSSCVNRQQDCSISTDDVKQIAAADVPNIDSNDYTIKYNASCCSTDDCNKEPIADWTTKALVVPVRNEPVTKPESFCQQGVEHDIALIPKLESGVSACSSSIENPVCFRIEAELSYSGIGGNVTYTSCENRDSCTSITCESFKKTKGSQLLAGAPIDVSQVVLSQCKMACCDGDRCNTAKVNSIDAITTTTPEKTTATPDRTTDSTSKALTAAAEPVIPVTTVSVTQGRATLKPVTTAKVTSARPQITSAAKHASTTRNTKPQRLCQQGVEHNIRVMPDLENGLSACNDSIENPVCFRIEGRLSYKGLGGDATYTSCENRESCTSITCESFKKTLESKLLAGVPINVSEVVVSNCKLACCDRDRCNIAQVDFIDAITTTTPITTTVARKTTTQPEKTTSAAESNFMKYSALAICTVSVLVSNLF